QDVRRWGPGLQSRGEEMFERKAPIRWDEESSKRSEKSNLSRVGLLLLLVCLLAVGAAGCGSSSDSTTSPSTEAGSTSDGEAADSPANNGLEEAEAAVAKLYDGVHT